MGSGSNSGFWLCGGHPNVIRTPTQTKTTGDWMVQAGEREEKRKEESEDFYVRKKQGRERVREQRRKKKNWSLGGMKVVRLQRDE